MKPVYFTEEALKYRNEWVAFSLDCQQVLGHGHTPEEATYMAEETGEEYFMYFIPDESGEIIVQ